MLPAARLPSRPGHRTPGPAGPPHRSGHSSVGQPDDNQSNFVALHEFGQCLEILSLRAARQHAEWLGNRPRWIAEREAEPDRARIDREDPHGLALLLATPWILSVIRELKNGSQGRPNGDWVTLASTTFWSDWRKARPLVGLIPFKCERIAG